MGRAITTVTKPTFEQLKMMGADIAHIWSQHSSDFTQYLIHVHRRYPMAELADPMDWHRAVGSTVPLPISENDPKKKRQAFERKLKDLGPQPPDPESLSHWLHSIEVQRIHRGEVVKYANAEQAIAGGRQDMLDAMEMRDRWRLSQAAAQARSIDDRTMQGREAQREALAKVEALAERLAAERDEAMARLKTPAPAVAEDASEVAQ
jgi:hypothetical protein